MTFLLLTGLIFIIMACCTESLKLFFVLAILGALCEAGALILASYKGEIRDLDDEE